MYLLDFGSHFLPLLYSNHILQLLKNMEIVISFVGIKLLEDINKYVSKTLNLFF